MIEINDYYTTSDTYLQNTKEILERKVLFKKTLGDALREGDWVEMKKFIKHNVSPDKKENVENKNRRNENILIFKMILNEFVENVKYNNVYTYTDNVEILKLLINLEDDKDVNKQLIERLNKNINKLVNNNQNNPFEELHVINSLNNIVYDDILKEKDNLKLADVVIEKINRFVYNHSLYFENGVLTGKEREILIKATDNKAKILERGYQITPIEKEESKVVIERMNKLQAEHNIASDKISNYSKNKKDSEENLEELKRLSLKQEKELEYLRLKEAKIGLENNAGLKNFTTEAIKFAQTAGLAYLTFFNTVSSNAKVAVAEKASLLTILTTKLNDEAKVRAAFSDKTRQREEREKARNGKKRGWGEAFLNLSRSVVKFFDFTSFKPKVQSSNFNSIGKEDVVKKKLVSIFDKVNFGDLCKNNFDIYLKNTKKITKLSSRLETFKGRFGGRLGAKADLKDMLKSNQAIQDHLVGISDKVLTPTAQEKISITLNKNFREANTAQYKLGVVKKEMIEAENYYNILEDKTKEPDILAKIAFNTYSIESNDLKDENIFFSVFDKLILLNDFSTELAEDKTFAPSVKKDFDDTLNLLEKYLENNLSSLDENKLDFLNSNIRNFVKSDKKSHFSDSLKTFSKKIETKAKTLNVKLTSKNERIIDKLNNIIIKNNLESLSSDIKEIQKDAGFLKKIANFVFNGGTENKIDDIEILHSMLKSNNVVEYNKEYILSCFEKSVGTFVNMKKENYSSYKINKNKIKEIVKELLEKKIIDPHKIQKESELLIKKDIYFEKLTPIIKTFIEDKVNIEEELSKYSNSLENENVILKQEFDKISGNNIASRLIWGENPEKKKAGDLLQIKQLSLNLIQKKADDNSINNIVNVLDDNKDLITKDLKFNSAYKELLNIMTMLVLKGDSKVKTINNVLKNDKIIKIDNNLFLMENNNLNKSLVDDLNENNKNNNIDMKLNEFRKKIY